VQQLDEQLHDLRGETERLNRELKGRLELLQKSRCASRSSQAISPM